MCFRTRKSEHMIDCTRRSIVFHRTSCRTTYPVMVWISMVFGVMNLDHRVAEGDEDVVLIIARLGGDLSDDIRSDQINAAYDLARIAEFSKTIVPRLRELFDSDDTNLKLHALDAIWEIEGRSPEHMGFLIESLHNEESEIRIKAAEMLGRLGRRANPAKEALIVLLRDEVPAVRVEAAQAIGNIGPMAKEAIPALLAGLRDHGEVAPAPLYPLTVGMACSLALRAIGPEAIKACAHLYADQDPVVRELAIYVLKSGGGASRPFLGELLNALDDGTREVQLASLDVLGTLQVAPRRSLPAIAKLLANDDLGVRIMAVKSIAQFGSESILVIDDLIRALDDSHPNVRAMVAELLGDLGPAASKALPALYRHQEDKAFFFSNTTSPAARPVQDNVLPAIEKILANGGYVNGAEKR